MKASSPKYEKQDHHHVKPKEFNVYFARGHKYDSYPGNKIYRRSIQFYSPLYKKCVDMKQKSVIVDKVIASITSKDGKFFQQIRKGESLFKEVSSSTVGMKNRVRQALRDTKIEKELQAFNDSDKKKHASDKTEKRVFDVRETSSIRNDHQKTNLHWQENQGFSYYSHHNAEKSINKKGNDINGISYQDPHSTWQNTPIGVDNACVVDKKLKRSLHSQQQQQHYFSQCGGSNYFREAKAPLSTKINKDQSDNIQHFVKQRQSIQSNQSFIPMIDENEYDCQGFQSIDQHPRKKDEIQLTQDNNHSLVRQVTNEGINEQTKSFIPVDEHSYSIPEASHQQHCGQLNGQFQLVHTQVTEQSESECIPNFKHEFTRAEVDVIMNILF